MNADRLLALYERVADAPDAIARLRRFVLDLAVRGKLVEQNPGDEPAALLLDRIAAEKARRVKAGELRRPREHDEGHNVQELFAIPRRWRWCRLDEIGAIIGGGTPSAADPANFAEPGEGFPWLTPADLGKHNGLYIERGLRDLSENGLQSSSATVMPAGSVLFTSRAPIGYVAIAANPLSTNQGFKSIVPYVAECARFIALGMQAFGPGIDAKASGTTFKEVSGKIVAGIPFPLPPLAEQRRIVAKVDELMALLDRLEAARAAREATRERLAAATLARLTEPEPDPETARTHARFALETLPALTTRPDQIKALRRAVVGLAVTGRLVPRHEGDDRSNQMRLRSDSDAETFDLRAFEKKAERFCIPKGWSLQPLSRVCSHIVDCPHTTPRWTENGVLCIKTNQVRAGTLDLSIKYFVSEETYRERIDRLEPRADDILYIREGGILGVGCRIPVGTRLCLGQRLMLMRTNQSISSTFLEVVLNSPWITDFAAEQTAGGAAPRVNMSIVRGYPIPLPPLAEQHRIVAKVDALMALCDHLEATLATADATRRRLLEALLRDALAPATEVLEAAE